MEKLIEAALLFCSCADYDCGGFWIFSLMRALISAEISGDCDQIPSYVAEIIERESVYKNCAYFEELKAA